MQELISVLLCMLKPAVVGRAYMSSAFNESVDQPAGLYIDTASYQEISKLSKAHHCRILTSF